MDSFILHVIYLGILSVRATLGIGALCRFIVAYNRHRLSDRTLPIELLSFINSALLTS